MLRQRIQHEGAEMAAAMAVAMAKAVAMANIVCVAITFWLLLFFFFFQTCSRTTIPTYDSCLAERGNKLSSIVAEGREAQSSGEAPYHMHNLLVAIASSTSSEPERNNRLATFAKLRSICILT